MTETAAILLAVAKELANRANEAMPEIRKGESIRKEWLEDGIYSRETVFDGTVFLSQYDFRQRKSRRVATIAK